MWVLKMMFSKCGLFVYKSSVRNGQSGQIPSKLTNQKGSNFEEKKIGG